MEAPQRGVHGATSGTLNERFIKCTNCRVNVPKEDMLSLGTCTVCKRPYEAVVARTDGTTPATATVAFDRSGAPAIDRSTPKRRKRWAVLTSKRGRVYYHNTETGEDRWDEPPDVAAEAVEDAFVPFKNDAVKKAVLREQMKLDAAKRGVPIEVVAAVQQRWQHEDRTDDPFDRMVARGGERRRESTLPEATSPVQKAVASPRREEQQQQQEQHGEQEQEQHGEQEQEQQATRDAAKSCGVM
ncbi:unnamed protein product [Hyaloperonospora brassicae]|uniref:WW domain-containing protein n=1 Tax=Hyaloperonospora brassicae TaxID=162125 RepID=A0AAV0TJH5_HYABA|nr:unnamed protein product [Hyaloperonospora brassicae]